MRLKFILLIITMHVFSSHSFAQENYIFHSILDVYKVADRFDDIEQILKDAKGAAIKTFQTNEAVYLFYDEGKKIKYIEKRYEYNGDDNEIKAKEEYLAYKLSKDLGLKLVAPTVYFKTLDTDEETFVNVRQLYIEESISPPKLQPTSGFEKEGSPIPVFDDLIGQNDRFYNNYLFAKDGSIIAIDHEGLFVGGEYQYLFQKYSKLKDIFNKIFHPKKYETDDVKSFFYEKEIWDKFLLIDWNHWIEEHFPSYIFDSPENTLKKKKIFLEKIKTLMKQTQSKIQKEGIDSFFNSAKLLREKRTLERKTFYESYHSNRKKTKGSRMLSIPSDC